MVNYLKIISGLMIWHAKDMKILYKNVIEQDGEQVIVNQMNVFL